MGSEEKELTQKAFENKFSMRSHSSVRGASNSIILFSTGCGNFNFLAFKYSKRCFFCARTVEFVRIKGSSMLIWSCWFFNVLFSKINLGEI